MDRSQFIQQEEKVVDPGIVNNSHVADLPVLVPGGPLGPRLQQHLHLPF